ncbi:MAG: UxaA family hydrolase [Caldilineaceae bacterium SB0661_bin_32]|uniref:UxaA family hydrolase n=1 Tax=Caldilineaceae bacterium SB0661_bin_32 TaxID=2605255 RepID=A0A6B1D8K3_9CHLR|nr:UxaA family hydrolase [Caldilineaceae bacterium SB0661_bin_32]
MPDIQSGLLLLISDEDNVYVLLRGLSAGDSLMLGEKTVVVENSLDLGHKIAARDIAAGEKIVKYGAPIGSAARDIRAGEHVHLHNIKSDYIPTYTLNSETD